MALPVGRSSRNPRWRRGYGSQISGRRDAIRGEGHCCSRARAVYAYVAPGRRSGPGRGTHSCDGRTNQQSATTLGEVLAFETITYRSERKSIAPRDHLRLAEGESASRRSVCKTRGRGSSTRGRAPRRGSRTATGVEGERATRSGFQPATILLLVTIRSARVGVARRSPRTLAKLVRTRLRVCGSGEVEAAVLRSGWRAFLRAQGDCRIDRGGECRVRLRGFGKERRKSVQIMQCPWRCKRCCAREYQRQMGVHCACFGSFGLLCYCSDASGAGTHCVAASLQ